LATAGDIVADPSAPDAFVRGIMEGVEYYYDVALQEWVETRPEKVEEIQEVVEEIKETGHRSARELEEQASKLFRKFMNKLAKS